MQNAYTTGKVTSAGRIVSIEFGMASTCPGAMSYWYTLCPSSSPGGIILEAIGQPIRVGESYCEGSRWVSQLTLPQTTKDHFVLIALQTPQRRSGSAPLGHRILLEGSQ